MEIVGDDGTKIELNEDSDAVFGRGQGHPPKDRNVSRRHISFKFNSRASPSSRVSFEVIGKNPIWVRRAENGEIMAFRRHESGKMRIGDSFCVSPNDPVWFKLKTVGVEEAENSGEVGERGRELSVSLEQASSGMNSDEDDLGSLDVSSIDPVQEFGFLVIGHEFDNYPKQMIRDVRTWNWFLQDPSKESSDDEGSDAKGEKSRRKRKKSRGAEDNDDEEWTGESEDEKEVATRVRKPLVLKYETRSTDHFGSHKDVGSSKRSGRKRSKVQKEVEDEDEEDETLGGFIVDDGNDEEGEEKDEEEEFEEEDEEEEFEEEEDDE